MGESLSDEDFLSWVLDPYPQRVRSYIEGKDALANVTVKVAFKGEPAIIGHGLNIDTMLASARAYIGALNSYLSMEGKLKSRHSDSSKTI
jgi:2-isopropylmalate synthase